MPKIGNIELPDFPLLLAPMEDVSDPPFRRLCKLHGADLMYSEFISSEGLIRDAVKSKQKLDIFDYGSAAICIRAAAIRDHLFSRGATAAFEDIYN
jgi:tRNA-dihydrouridine synthase